MVINGRDLFHAAPIKDMQRSKQSLHGVSHGMSEAGYDIRIKQSVEFRLVPLSGSNEETIWTGVQLPGTEPSFDKGRFCIASAIEEFQMPDDLMGIVHDKSTWARKGLSVFNTVIEPGWRGFLTLELVYHGNTNLVIPAGAGIAQVVFHKLRCKAGYQGKYQNQENRPVPARQS